MDGSFQFQLNGHMKILVTIIFHRFCSPVSFFLFAHQLTCKFCNNLSFASSKTDAGIFPAWVHLQMSKVLPDAKNTCMYVHFSISKRG